MTKIAGKGQLKFMVAGLGWAAAELVVTRCVLDFRIENVEMYMYTNHSTARFQDRKCRDVHVYQSFNSKFVHVVVF